MRSTLFGAVAILGIATTAGYLIYRGLHEQDQEPTPVLSEAAASAIRDARLERALSVLLPPDVPPAPAPAPINEPEVDLPVEIGTDRETVETTLGEPVATLDGNRAWVYPRHMVMFKDDVVSGVVERDEADAMSFRLATASIEPLTFEGAAPQMTSGGHIAHTSRAASRSSVAGLDSYRSLSPDQRFGLNRTMATRLERSTTRQNRARTTARSIFGWRSSSSGDPSQRLSISEANRLSATSRSSSFKAQRYKAGGSQQRSRYRANDRYRGRMAHSLRFLFTSQSRKHD